MPTIRAATVFPFGTAGEEVKSHILKQRGHFWWRDEPIPEGHFAPDNHVTGVLTIQRDGTCNLELDGEMFSSEHFLTRMSKRHNSQKLEERPIQGILKDTGQHVILLDAISNGGTFHSNRFSYEKYFATRCLVSDVSFPQGKTPFRFSFMHVELVGLEDWLRLGSIEVSRTERLISAKQKKQKEISYKLGDAQVFLEHFTAGPYRGKRRTHKLDLKESITLVFRPNKSQTSEEIREELISLQDLFIVLTDSNYSLHWPTLTPTRSKARYTFYFQRQVSKAPTPIWHQCPTNFVCIKSDFGQILDRWRNGRERYNAGFYSYISTRRDTKLYVENGFSNLVGGLEVFHRIKYPTSISSELLGDKIQRILGDLKLTKDRKWLARFLTHKNEPSLEQRLLEVIQGLSLNFKDDRVRAFAKACADRRNDIAHFMGERQKGNRAKFILDTSAKSHALGRLYHAALLLEVGIDHETVRHWLFEGANSLRSKFYFVQAGLLDKKVLEPKIPKPS